MGRTFADRILEGKAAYVAGGTRGMNLAIARRYAEHGASVAVMSRNEDRVAAAVKELEGLGGQVLGFAADARDYDRVAETMERAAAAFGGLDLVVAGQAGNFYAPAVAMSANGFRSVVDIDLNGTFHVFRASFEHLRRPGASLLAITAPEAVRPLHFQAHVCAAKAGVNQIIRVLAIEWGAAGVRVNGISPGPIEGSWGMENVVLKTPGMREKITRAIPLKRWGTVDDVANAALFLASDAGSWITGTILEVDGGVTIASPEQGEVDAVLDPQSDGRVRHRANKDG